MTGFTAFSAPPDGAAGFHVIAGPEQGLRRLLLVGGRLPAGDNGPVHRHAGDEVLRVLAGELLVRVGEERRTCGPGDVVVVPPNVAHGFRALADTLLEVLAEQDISTYYQVRGTDGAVRLMEAVRADMPWSPPPGPDGYTSDAEMAAILANLVEEV